MSRTWLIVPLLVLYLFDLGGTGFLGPDEPRYASIGREMEGSDDLVTPRLDGSPWFEKPPLLYWLTAAGKFLHLPDEWAARLPLGLISIAFLMFFFQTVADEFSLRRAFAATAILATSAGWLAYSFVAVTDLLMSATLGTAILIALFDTRRDQGYVAGALLGLSILAKSFVPLVLFAPMFLVARGKRLTMLAGCIVIAAPWYVVCGLRNGPAFWRELIWKQQVERFFTPALQHVQPFWYYVPILLAGLFPWTPLAGLLFRGKTYKDVRVLTLAGWVLFGLVFFSASKNKLPGYVLPLMPVLAIVLASALEDVGAQAKWWLSISALMLAGLPVIMRALPDGLLFGFRKAPFGFGSPASLFAVLAFVILGAGVWWLAWRDRVTEAILTMGIAVIAAVTYLKIETFPVLDARVSVRGFWRANQSQAANACLDNVRRDWEYGLNYYAGRALPPCSESDARPRITVKDRRLVLLN